MDSFETVLRAKCAELETRITKALEEGADDAEVDAITAEVKRLQQVKQVRDDEDGIRRQMEAMYAQSAGAVGFADHFLKAGFDPANHPSAAVPAVPALGIKAATMPDVEDLNRLSLSDVQPHGRDARRLYPRLVIRDASNTTAIEDFRETARSTSGNVQRGIAASTDKATLNTTIEHVVAALVQWAVVLPDIPNAVLGSREAFRALFDGSMKHEVQAAIDAHVIAAILAADPPAGNTGTGLVAQIRNAVAAMRGEGANPTLLALSPSDAAALDLFEDTGGSLVFATRTTGSSSPVWDLRVAEVAGLEDPLLIDPAKLGVLALASIQIDADPYTGFRKNLTSLRAETTGLMHVRSAAGARRIGTTG